MNIDEVLNQDAEVRPLSRDTYEAARAAVDAAAHADIARVAKIVRLRRRRRLLVGVAAAAVAGVAVVSQVSGGARPGTAAHDRVPPPSTTGTTDGDVTVQFTTVAQVTNAAAIASGGAYDFQVATGRVPLAATAFPYWKVVTATTCGNAEGEYACDLAMWVGNGRGGAMRDGTGAVTASCAGTGTIDGQTLPWSTINARRWTDTQVATLVADNADANKEGRPPSEFYVMKNAIGLLTYTPASATIRKQLWKELADIPGMRLDGQQKDSLGRTGWRLTLGSPQDGYGTQSLLVDTNTGMVLEETDQAPGLPKNVTTVRAAGPVDTAPSPTPGSLKPMC